MGSKVNERSTFVCLAPTLLLSFARVSFRRGSSNQERKRVWRRCGGVEGMRIEVGRERKRRRRGDEERRRFGYESR